MGNKFALLVQEAAKSKEAPKIEVRSKKLKASVDNYLSKIIKTLPQLEQCIIKSCKLKSIPNEISALENLVSLVLEDAGLSDLPKVQLKKIQRISLRKNQIVQIPSLILNSQSITHVDISFNLITELPDQLSTLNNLVELNLEGNCFSKFPRVVLSLTKLTSLNLTSCGVGSIPAEITKLVNLQQLFLNANNLKKLPVGFQQLTKIEHLELASNNFEVFPKKIFSLTNLTKLNLAHNKIKRLPHSQLPQLSKLVVFKVNDNALDRLPSTIKLLSELKELYVHENQIEALPKNIHRCLQLNILRAEYNKITDVPAKTKQLEKLTVLMLHNNNLTAIPSALLDSNFLKHVFTVSLDENPLPESDTKAIKEKGSRIYLLDNAAEKTETSQQDAMPLSSSMIEGSVSLPDVPILGRKYDTVGRSSSAGSSTRRRKLSDVVVMSHSSSSLPVVTPTVSESASAPTSPNKAKRRSIRSLTQIKEAEASNSNPSPTKTRNFTVTSQKESKDKPERSLTASSPDVVRRRKSTSLSLSDVELGFLEELKGVVPPYSKFREAFESLLETQDLSENRKEQLKRMKDADKWRVLRLYKGDTISLLLDNKPKKKNKERDEMMSLIDGLKSDDISYLKRLHELLVQSDAQLYLFVDTGGVPLLVDLLQQTAMTPRETSGLKDRHIEVLGCLLELAETTIKTLLTTPNLVSSILACLDIDDDVVMRLSVTLLEIITAVDPEIGPKLLVEGLVQLKKRRKSPFLTSPIASILKTKNVEIKAMALAIINEVLDSNESLIERCRMRNEIIKLVTADTFKELERLADENEQVKVVIEHFNESRQEDEEDLKSASASDVNVMISINATEDNKMDDGPEKKPSGSSLLASLSRARVAGDRKPFKVVVTDVAGTGANSYMMMYTDDTTVQELIDKVLGRLPAEQLKPLQNNKCGLFIIPDHFRDASPNSLTDSTDIDNDRGPDSRPPSEGSFADPSSLVTSITNLSNEGLGYLKLLPWKLTIHCNVGENNAKRVINVEADPFTLLSEFVLRIARQLILPSDDEYVLAVLKPSSNANEQRADPEHDENEEIQTRALKSLSDKNTGFDELRLLDTKPLMFYQHEMHAGEIHLKPKPEVVKVMFNDETYVNIEVYARDLVKDVIAAINEELKGTSMRDYGLVLETKTQANDSSVHSEWLEPDRTLRSYTDPFKNKYRLRYTSQPQDVFIKIIDDEKKFTVNLDEKISEIIYYVCKTENYSGTYSLYMNDKLLNRRQSLKEAGVSPGDHLILKEESTITEEGSRAAIDEDDVNIYDEGDGEKFICYVEAESPPLNSSKDLSASKMEIEHATLNKLVARVTDADNYDANFQDIFIFTYRSFTSPDMLLHKLIQRYSTKDKVSESVAERIRVRAIFFVCQWLERDYHNLDKSVVEKLMIFIETTVGHERGQQLLKILDRVSKTKPESPNLSLPHVPFKFKGTIRTPKLIDLDEVTIARQLTLDVWRIYARIKPEEFFDQAWAKPSLQHLAPNVLKLITSFNYYSNWVASEIVMEKKLRQRRVLVAKVIKIAQLLREMNNYHLAYALITGLNNVAVSRLKWTIEKLGRAPKLMLQNLEQLMGMEGSFKNYRDSVSGVSGVPCVPYIGVTLKDMTFVEDGNPNMIGDLINWAKRKLIYTVVANFLRFNKIDYIIEPITVADDYPIERLIKEASQLNDDELFEHSLQCEPRGAKPHQLT